MEYVALTILYRELLMGGTLAHIKPYYLPEMGGSKLVWVEP